MANRVGIIGRTVDLYVRFVDSVGNPVNTDDTPTVSIKDSAGTTHRAASRNGVSLAEDPGLYLLTYEIPDNFSGNDSYGEDTWVAEIGGEAVSNTFDFQVLDGGALTASAPQEYTPGDDYEFVFTKEETIGMNKLLKILKRRLKSNGVRKIPDGAGGFTESPCHVFSDDELICFLVNSLSTFNSEPHFTSYSFADPPITDIFLDIIIQGAVLLGLAAQALIEKGREFSITDSGLTYMPPAISEILNTQYNSQLADYKDKLKKIKNNLKPGPRAIGSWRPITSAPAFTRLRHLRARQII